MASFLERAKIQRDAQLNPFAIEFTPPSDTTLAEVQGAVTFLRRVRGAVEDVAHEIIMAAVAGSPSATGPENERVIWAQKVINGDRYEFAVLRLILAEFDATPPGELASVTDEQIQGFVAGVVPVLARGIRK